MTGLDKSADINRGIDEAVDALAGTRRVTALTGAGISAESGVPTFRGNDGLWKRYRSEELATPEAFHRDPSLVWEWYNWRRELIAPKKPNPGHGVLASLEQRLDFTLITQNVDGLHQLAGSKRLLELHGNIWRVRCVDCGLRKEDRTIPLPFPPRCSRCGGMLRPDVVWFGESLDSHVLEAAFKHAGSCEVMLVIGTSAIVQPAALLAYEAKRGGAFVIEINLESTPFSSKADVVLKGRAGNILPQIFHLDA